MADSDDRDGFLSRWSVRKRQARRPAKEIAPVESLPAQDPEESQALSEEEIVARLPEIETLDDASDFAAFLEEGVPEALRRKALRKLWRVNPVLANLDGLNDYDDDYTVAEPVLKTLYQAGKGMVAEEGEGDRTPEDQARQVPDQDSGSEESTGDEEATDGGMPSLPESKQVAADCETTVTSNSAGQPAVPAGAPEAPSPESPTPESPTRGAARKRRWGETSSLV